MKKISVFRSLRVFLLLFIMVGIAGGLYLISTQRLGILPKAAPDTPTVRLFFEADTELARGKEFSLLLKLNPKEASVRAFEAYVSYDPQKVEPAGNLLDDLSQAYNAEQGFFRQITPDKEKNTVRAYGAKIGGDPISGTEDIELAKIRFKVKGEAGEVDEIAFKWTEETKIASDDSALNVSLEEGLFVLGSKESKKKEVKVDTVVPTSPPAPNVPPVVETTSTPAIQPTLSPALPTKPAPPKTTPTVVPTSGVGPSPTPTGPAGSAGKTATVTVNPDQKVLIGVNLLLKFQGVTTAPADSSGVPVAVTVDGGGLTAPVTQSVLFIPKEDGVWSGSLSLSNIAPGAGYKIHTKGPRHVGKTFSQITLSAGTTSLDFTDTPQPAGDLSASNNRQDGVVNAADTSFILTHLLSSDPKIVDSADTNFDGVLNAIDYALILQTLGRGVKKDEAL